MLLLLVWLRVGLVVWGLVGRIVSSILEANETGRPVNYSVYSFEQDEACAAKEGRMSMTPKFAIILINVLFGLALFAWPIVMYVSTFFFVNPVQDEISASDNVFMGIFSYPLFYFAGLLWSKKAWKQGNTGKSILIAPACPLLPVTFVFFNCPHFYLK
jgi:hypothetical protein